MREQETPFAYQLHPKVLEALSKLPEKEETEWRKCFRLVSMMDDSETKRLELNRLFEQLFKVASE